MQTNDDVPTVPVHVTGSVAPSAKVTLLKLRPAGAPAVMLKEFAFDGAAIEVADAVSV